VAKRHVEEVVRRAAQDFDSFYLERRLAWPTEAGPSNILVLTFDGKGVPMRPEDLRPATQAAAAQRQRKLTTRLMTMTRITESTAAPACLLLAFEGGSLTA
jgi:hypothetical protein